MARALRKSRRVDESMMPAESRLMAAIRESVRLGRTLFCPSCGALQHALLFQPGTEFPCGRCGETVSVPIDVSMIVDAPLAIDGEM